MFLELLGEMLVLELRFVDEDGMVFVFVFECILKGLYF